MSPGRPIHSATSSICDNDAIYEVGPQASASTACTFPDGPSTATVGVLVSDGDGGVDTDTVSVTVDDVSPTIEATAPATIDEGATLTLTLGATHDPGQDTITAWSIDWGDDSAPTTGVGSPASTDPTHIYADGPDDPTITVTVTDEDGDHAAASLAVHVSNVAPTVTLTGATTDEGSTHTYGFTVSDPGTDTFVLDDTTCGPAAARPAATRSTRPPGRAASTARSPTARPARSSPSPSATPTAPPTATRSPSPSPTSPRRSS